MIIEGAEPFFMPGGEHGVLLVHGFTGMPPEMVLLADALHEAGFTVLTIRLCGHGTSPEDMQRTNAADWYDSVIDGYSILSGFCPRISVIGHSMGGLLSLKLAADKRIEKVVTLGAPIFIDESRHMGYLPSRADCMDKYYPKIRNRCKHIPGFVNLTYKKMPLIAVHELVDFIEEIKGRLAEVKVPIRLFHGTQDRTAKIESAQYICDAVSSTDKAVIHVDAGHMIMLSDVREDVFDACTAFLKARDI
ncbi:carboxylesterase [Selenomonas sp. TAMA-11512]|uniref:alpha/beta hydrolase n=1 Tax=Selenomonas sp. TAMA-11512 TaxID=3095337 RepID=UPI0030878CF1|nr:carboxylesterase [Selenomonas sp. TAMA-11512]